MPLLEGVPLVLLGDEKEDEEPPPPPPPAAAAARLVGVDFGDPARAAGVLLPFPRVDTGDPGSEDCPVLSREGDGDGNTDALTLALDPDAADRLNDRGGDESAGLEAAPRFTGVCLGDTGGFLGEAAAPADP